MIAIIAGTGNLPLEACKALLAENKDFFVVALFPENNLEALQNIVTTRAEIIVQPFFKPGKILKLLEDKGTKQLLFIGKVEKNNLLKNLKLDWFALKILASLFYKSDKAIMEKLIEEINARGISVISQDVILKGLLVPPGVLTGKLTSEIEQEVSVGLDAAIAIAHADIGQTVVVKDKMIVAVEAIEGTDKCIKRGIELGNGNVVVCKAARTDQNKKFDLPTLGPASLASIKRGEVKAIAWRSSHTLIASREQFIKDSQERGITLISVDR